MAEVKRILHASGTVAEVNLISEITSQLDRNIFVDYLIHGVQLARHLKTQPVKPELIILEPQSPDDIRPIVASVREEPGCTKIPFIIFIAAIEIPSIRQEISDERVFLLPKPTRPSELKYYFKLMVDFIRRKYK